MNWLILLLLILAAGPFEAGGGIMIREGRVGGGAVSMIAGAIIIGCSGLLINALPWRFSSVMGVFASVFAVLNIGWQRIVSQKEVTRTMWLGTAFVAVGGMIVATGEFR